MKEIQLYRFMFKCVYNNDGKRIEVWYLFSDDNKEIAFKKASRSRERLLEEIEDGTSKVFRKPSTVKEF